MKVSVLGGGPAGLYLSILLKKADPRHEVQVFERNAADATFGWGVVFSEGSLDELEDADYESYVALTEGFARWDPIDVRYRGERVRVRGNAFSGVGRRELLRVLQRRAAGLGVELRFHSEVRSLEELPESDLVVGADGVNSTVRAALADDLRPSIDHAPSRYAWYGSDLAFPVFTYLFKETRWGLFQAHCYPYAEDRSTMVLLLSEETWRRAGLDERSEAESLELCEGVFAEELQGHRMLSNRSLWTSFPFVSCRTWHSGNVVVLGDAAHTAHWSVGSGTKLALEDAIALARACVRWPGNLSAALNEFEMERQPVVERLQEASRASCDYFQSVQRYFSFEPLQFAYQLMTRTPRITHASLALRDPEFVRAVDGWFHSRGPGLLVAPPPAFAPLRLRSVELPSRVAFREGPLEAGAGLVVSAPHAVSPEGRISPETPLAADLEPAPRSGSVVALRLVHAGRRGSTRPPRAGLDRPLREGGWPLVSASPLPYAPWSPVPRELTRAGMERVRDQFAAATRQTLAAGYRVLLLDFAHGHLLASFISPLSNQRRDRWGGSLEARMRFPLEVLAAVRAEWPEELPLAVAVAATDWLPGGLPVAEAVGAAAMLAAAGCDLVQVLAGQTVPEAHPQYGRAYGGALSDRIRNEAGVATMACGQITTLDEVNTLLAAGRADLCLLDRLSRTA